MGGVIATGRRLIAKPCYRGLTHKKLFRDKNRLAETCILAALLFRRNGRYRCWYIVVLQQTCGILIPIPWQPSPESLGNTRSLSACVLSGVTEELSLCDRVVRGPGATLTSFGSPAGPCPRVFRVAVRPRAGWKLGRQLRVW